MPFLYVVDTAPLLTSVWQYIEEINHPLYQHFDKVYLLRHYLAAAIERITLLQCINTDVDQSICSLMTFDRFDTSVSHMLIWQNMCNISRIRDYSTFTLAIDFNLHGYLILD